MEDDDGKYKGHFEVPPKSKGGRRSRSPKQIEAFKKNLRPWKPGQSGNVGGTPKSVQEIQRMAREMTPAVLKMFGELAHDPKVPPRDRIAAGIAISDRGCGRPAIGIFHGTAETLSSPLMTEAGEPVSALIIRAARENRDERALADLRAETRRLEDKLARDKQAHEAHLADAAEALSRGEEVDGLTRLLIQAKAANADRKAAEHAAKPQPAKQPAPTEPEGSFEDPDDFIVDSAGNTATTKSTAPPFNPNPPPPPEPKAAPPKAKPKYSGIPADAAAHFQARDASQERSRQNDDYMKKRQEAARLDPVRYPGGVIPMSELRADVEEGRLNRDQGPLEVVNFTRMPGGRGIKRC